MADTPTTKPADRTPSPSLHVDYEAPVVRRRRPNRVVAWVRGWADEHLSREQVAGGLQTLLWVAPLTVLIWIYAERQQQDLRGGVVLPLSVVSGDPTKIVWPISPRDGNVVVTLRGPRGAIDEALKKFNPLTPGNRPVEIQLDRSSGLGEQRIRALRIGEDKRLSAAGITVDAVEPNELRVYVDQIVPRKLPVQVANNRQSFGAPPVFDPKEVEVSGPSRTLDNPASGLRVEADLAARLGPGQQVDREVLVRDVKLSLVGVAKEDLDNIKLAQTSVNARVTPAARREATLPTVRLAVAAPKILINENSIEFPEPLTNVKVSGPPDAIEALENDTGAHVAYVQITREMTGPGEKTSTASILFPLPPGVTWDDEPELKKIRVTLKPR